MLVTHDGPEPEGQDRDDHRDVAGARDGPLVDQPGHYDEGSQRARQGQVEQGKEGGPRPGQGVRLADGQADRQGQDQTDGRSRGVGSDGTLAWAPLEDDGPVSAGGGAGEDGQQTE